MLEEKRCQIMRMKGMFDAFYRFTEWILRLALLNILWVLFTLAGGVILGLMPATAAMFSVARKWISDDADIHVYQTFVKEYKSDFWRVNLFGYTLLFMSAIVFENINFYSAQQAFIWHLLNFAFIGIAIMVAAMCMYAFPTFVTYRANNLRTIKLAMIAGLFNPGRTLLMLLITCAIILLGTMLPAVCMFFMGSTWAYLLTHNAIRVFSKVDYRMLPSRLIDPIPDGLD